MMFNLFRKDKQKIVEEEKNELNNSEESEGELQAQDICAAITYYITREGTPFVDIQITEADVESSLFLSELLKGIYSNDYFAETLEMIKDGFIDQGKAELYIAVAARLGSVLKTSTDDKPCISPSDIFE